MGGEPGLVEDASQRCRVSIPGHRDIHLQGGYCRYEPMVPAVSRLMRQAPTAGDHQFQFSHVSDTCGTTAAARAPINPALYKDIPAPRY